MNKVPTPPPGTTLVGARFPLAEYRDPIVPSHKGNPLIEALAPIRTDEEIVACLKKLPLFDEKTRVLPGEIRSHCALDLLFLYAPLSNSIEVYKKVCRLIRLGYRERNPLEPDFWRTFENRVQTPWSSDMEDSRSSFCSYIAGMSGGGKTETIKQVCRAFPQVIRHENYHGQWLVMVQIVWLRMKCSFDGSQGGFCLNFFRAVDSLLGTSYQKQYDGSIQDRLQGMKRVCLIHGVGVLVIDEIQNLVNAGTRGEEMLLSFIREMTDLTGVPSILIGTYQAVGVLSKSLATTRRGSSVGDLVWNPLEHAPGNSSNEWTYFLKSIWKYQFTARPTPLSRELIDVIHHESAGVIDYAVKLYALSQIRAIELGGDEAITPNLVSSIALDCLNWARPAIAAIRNRDTARYIDGLMPETASLIAQAKAVRRAGDRA